MFTSNPNLSGSGRPCVLGLGPCVVLTHFNGSTLLWDDMRRTLAFAWEIHVYGSAGLFILMVVLAAFGTVGALTLGRPLCVVLTVANGLLVLSGAVRAAHLLIDPYGTRQIMSHATLAALHNIPLHLLLWAQFTVCLVTPTGLNLLRFPLKLQWPWVSGALAILHCTLLLVADLYSPVFSPVLPLLLQTLSICWGLPFCMGVLSKSISYLNMFLRSSVPQWVPSRTIEQRARRVTAVCAFLGVLCCSLHIYSLFWLYGLMGNWRRFSWGWWLSQFLARILELAWGFSLLVLGSWIFWTPSRGQTKGNHWQGRGEASKGVKKTSLWGRVLANIKTRKADNHWKDLMPKNWAKFHISNNLMCPCQNQPSSLVPEYKPDPASNSSSDSQTALLWQKVGERECILSVIEFDMRPPSPINLRRSIDNALHHGQLMAGGLFTPPPPSWAHTVAQDVADVENGSFPPSYFGFRWMLDTESIPTSLDHFQAKEPIRSPNDGAITTGNDHVEAPNAGHHTREFSPRISAVMHQHDWSDEDITDL